MPFNLSIEHAPIFSAEELRHTGSDGAPEHHSGVNHRGAVRMIA
jgi:hypothetical protein